MKPAELAEVREELLSFTAETFASPPRSDQRRWGETYLRGLMLDGGASRSSRWRHGSPTAASSVCSSS